MRRPLAVLAAAAVASAVVVAGSTGSAAAVLTVPTPGLTPLPSVSVPVPTPTLPGPGTGVPVTPPGTGGGGGGDGSGGGGPADTPAGTGAASAPAGTAATTGPSAGTARGPAATKRDRRARDATPMVAGTPQAKDLLDDEHSPELLAASKAFLTADQGIAEIARQKRLMAQLKASATEQATVYRALDLDVLTAQTVSELLHGRHDSVRQQLVSSARTAYVTGQPTTDDGTATGLAAAALRLGDGSTRADLRVGDLTVRRDTVRSDVERIAARYNEAKRRLDDANRVLTALAAQRSDALRAVLAAKGSDIALNRARVAESGALGAQIRTASAQLERDGRTVQGTGEMARPGAGHVTSPFGMRVHPILGYPKLHTGTDLAGGDPAVLAADSGRVIMTVVSPAYGNFTVVDHGVVDGRRVTTAYAHQALFLVRAGQVVRKGEQIGVVGSTGYSTGPHLHFEVREDGTVVDPIAWL